MTGSDDNLLLTDAPASALRDPINGIDVWVTATGLHAIVHQVTVAEHAPLQATARWMSDAWRPTQSTLQAERLLLTSTGEAADHDAHIVFSVLRAVRAAPSPFDALGQCAARGWNAPPDRDPPRPNEAPNVEKPSAVAPASGPEPPPAAMQTPMAAALFEPIGQAPPLNMPDVNAAGLFQLTLQDIGPSPERVRELLVQVLGDEAPSLVGEAPFSLGSAFRARDVRRVMVAVSLATSATFVWSPAPD